MRYYAAPDDTGFATIPDGEDDGQWGAVPDGWTEVTKEEYERRFAAARQQAEQRSAEFLRRARAPQVDAAQALVALGLEAEHAAAISGVPAADLTPVAR